MNNDWQDKPPSLWRLLRKVHEDEEGAVSIETVLIIAVIAIPILIVLYKFAWPAIRSYFFTGLEDLGVEVEEQ